MSMGLDQENSIQKLKVPMLISAFLIAAIQLPLFFASWKAVEVVGKGAFASATIPFFKESLIGPHTSGWGMGWMFSKTISMGQRFRFLIFSTLVSSMIDFKLPKINKDGTVEKQKKNPLNGFWPQLFPASI